MLTKAAKEVFEKHTKRQRKRALKTIRKKCSELIISVEQI